MDNFNKIVSFILGLVVVIVFFAVITGRIKLGKYTPSFAKKPTPTPTVVSTVKIEDKPTNVVYNNYQTTNKNTYSTKTPTTIPSSGLPTFFIPSLLAGVFGGSYLRKAGKK